MAKFHKIKLYCWWSHSKLRHTLKISCELTLKLLSCLTKFRVTTKIFIGSQMRVWISYTSMWKRLEFFYIICWLKTSLHSTTLILVIKITFLSSQNRIYTSFCFSHQLIQLVFEHSRSKLYSFYTCEISHFKICFHPTSVDVSIILI